MTQTTSCPNCGSDDAKYLSVVYESGLSSINTQTEGAIYNHRATKRNATTATTTGTVQSATSVKARPPARKSLKFSLLLAVIGLLLLSRHTAPGLLLLAAGSLWFYVTWTYNRRVYPYQYQVWEQSAMCQRCGTIFVPDETRITLDAVTTGQLLAAQQRNLVTAAQPVLNRARDLKGQMTQSVMQKNEDLKGAAHREGDAVGVEAHADPHDPGEEN